MSERVISPGTSVPPLRLETVGGPCWRLSDQKPRHFTLLLFHRGGACPACRALLTRLEDRIDDFTRRGVRVLAVSAEDRASAEACADSLGIDKLTLCWGLDPCQAGAWGLAGCSEKGGAVEPAVCLVRPDGRLAAATGDGSAFGSTLDPDGLLAAIDSLLDRRPAMR